MHTYYVERDADIVSTGGARLPPRIVNDPSRLYPQHLARTC